MLPHFCWTVKPMRKNIFAAREYKKGRVHRTRPFGSDTAQAAGTITSMAVMWGCAPSYQYRKPCRSTTSPTFQA